MKAPTYRDYAEQAAKAEHSLAWPVAYTHWLLAFETAKRTENRKWALARAMFCNAQLPPNQQLKFEERL